MNRHPAWLGVACTAGAWLALCAATAAPTPEGAPRPTVSPGVVISPSPMVTPALMLGGVTVGASVVEAAKRFGYPGVAQTTDRGTYWQWSDRDGLDREVYTDDALTVVSVVVARARPSSTAQPPEAPMLGLDAAGAAAAAAAAGAGALVTRPRRPQDFVWPLDGGFVAAETDGKAVVRVRALSVDFARRWGYAGDPLAVAPHTGASLVHEAVAHPLPAGRGDDLVLVMLDASGRVTDAKVVYGSGDSEVDWWTLKCVRSSTFKPATCSGVPCAGTFLFAGGIED